MYSNRFEDYIGKLEKRYKKGAVGEHGYRDLLKDLLERLIPKDLQIFPEPTGIGSDRPDYGIQNSNGLWQSFIETKDLTKDLDAKQDKEQFEGYQKEFSNLIITNYLQFRFFIDHKHKVTLNLGTLNKDKGTITLNRADFNKFETYIKDFFNQLPQSIKSPKNLAEIMALKAKLLKENLIETLNDNSNEENAFHKQHEAFKDKLISDLSVEQFADIYSQTLVYGMFTAWLQEPSGKTFSRQSAAGLIPKTNPFLRNFFGYISGHSINELTKPYVDELASIFSNTDIEVLESKSNDLIIYFYETFLAEYDPKLRKNRGVYYTPPEVVDFIVRGVDYLLNEKNLSTGLADSRTIKGNVPRVQILDPATGTGAFLYQVILQIYRTEFSQQQGVWEAYVNEQLLPRIHGFEIMMAPYTIAHLNLEYLLRLSKEIPVNMTPDKRFNVFLTNTLEKPDDEDQKPMAFAEWLSDEAIAADKIKREKPIMVILGNPPYSAESMNKGDWITGLIEDYKKEPGGKQKLQERNPKSINDDYVKFLRYAEKLLENNGVGICAYINSNGYIDNLTFRGMRWHLLNTYDEIYILDLHGNAKKEETHPDGSKDENVFDIQQGVAINFFVKTGHKKKGELAKVYHADLYGLREAKYQYLKDHSLDTVKFKQLSSLAPSYYLYPKDYTLEAEYNENFVLTKLFPVHSVGICTARDKLTIHQSKQSLVKTIERFLSLSDEEARLHFNLGRDARDWKIATAKADLIKHWPDNTKITPIHYRPFDIRYVYYTGKTKGFHCRPRKDVMQHFLAGENTGLIINKPAQGGADVYSDIFVTQNITDQSIFSAVKRSPYICPLYTYPDKDSLTNLEPKTCKPNLNLDIVNKIAKALGTVFDFNKLDRDESKNNIGAMNILDYCYAVLYTPNYRKRYYEFLKSDFPRVPYPKDVKQFWGLIDIGRELRLLHLLLKSTKDHIAHYPVADTNKETSNRIMRKIVEKDCKTVITPPPPIASILIMYVCLLMINSTLIIYL